MAAEINLQGKEAPLYGGIWLKANTDTDSLRTLAFNKAWQF